MNTPHYDDCVRYALRMKQVDGDTFKDTALRVYERHTANPGTLLPALSKGAILIPTIDTQHLSPSPDTPHLSAAVITTIDSTANTVSLYLPETNDIHTIPLDTFNEAWQAAGGHCTTAFPPDPQTYRPKLLDLTHVQLPDGFEELREAIAENAHDMWALERQSEGWTYGPARNDQRLETPDMVPYAQLPESEKQYDRVMAEDTLKLLTALGYRIEKD